MVNDDLDRKIIKIVPIFDYSRVAGGYFEIHFDTDELDPFKLSFVPFLDHRVRKDDKLFHYLKDSVGDGTVSHAIYNLYDIGFPVDDWVVEHVDMAKDNVGADLFNALMQFYIHLKSFGENSGSLEY
jgi:hypothetical protein